MLSFTWNPVVDKFTRKKLKVRKTHRNERKILISVITKKHGRFQTNKWKFEKRIANICIDWRAEWNGGLRPRACLEVVRPAKGERRREAERGVRVPWGGTETEEGLDCSLIHSSSHLGFSSSWGFYTELIGFVITHALVSSQIKPGTEENNPLSIFKIEKWNILW